MTDCLFVNCCSPTGEIISPISDVFNINHERGPYRTHARNYNCFGYAFGTYTWLHPFLTYGFIDERRDEEGWWLTSDKCEPFSEYITRFFPVDKEETALAAIADNLERNGYSNSIFEDIIGATAFDTPAAIQLIITTILACFSDVRVIPNFDELADDEYGIMMMTKETDFHFIRYNPKSGYYSHKIGGFWISRVNDPFEAFENGNYYYGLTYFAKKRQSCRGTTGMIQVRRSIESFISKQGDTFNSQLLN